MSVREWAYASQPLDRLAPFYLIKVAGCRSQGLRLHGHAVKGHRRQVARQSDERTRSPFAGL